jgi:hypothetical protein
METCIMIELIACESNKRLVLEIFFVHDVGRNLSATHLYIEKGVLLRPSLIGTAILEILIILSSQLCYHPAERRVVAHLRLS